MQQSFSTFAFTLRAFNYTACHKLLSHYPPHRYTQSKLSGIRQRLLLQFRSLLCERDFWMLKQENIKSKVPPVVSEYTGTIDCFRLRGVHTSTIPIMAQIICIHAELDGRKTNKSNCSRQCINGHTKFRWSVNASLGYLAVTPLALGSHGNRVNLQQ